MRKLLALLILSAWFSIDSLSQNVGIATDTPDASAVLEIYSKDKGVLIPRMTCEERDSIKSPADGLLVYVTDTCANGDLPGLFYFSSLNLKWNPIRIDISIIAGNTLDEAYDQGGAGSGRNIEADAGSVDIQGYGANDALTITNTGNFEGIDLTGTTGTGIKVLTTTGSGLTTSSSTDSAADLIFSQYSAPNSSDRFASGGHAGHFRNTSTATAKPALRATTLGTGHGLVGATLAVPDTFTAQENPNSSGVFGVSFGGDDRNGLGGVSDMGNGGFGRSEKVNSWTGVMVPEEFRAGFYGMGDDIGATLPTGASSPLYIGSYGYVRSGIGVLGINQGGGHGVVGISRATAGTASQAGVWGTTQDISGWSFFVADHPFLDASAAKGSVGVLAQSKVNTALWAESASSFGLIATTGDKQGLGDLTYGNSAIIGISTQTDASTAVFDQEGASTAPAVRILSNSGESGLFVNQNGTGLAVHISNNKNAMSPSTALLVEQFKTGDGAFIVHRDSTSMGNALKVEHTGLGKAGFFNIEDVDANMETAIYVETKGAGSAATFKVDDNDMGKVNMAPAVLITTDGKTSGLRVEQTNDFVMGGDENTEPAVDLVQDGIGIGVNLTTTNAMSSENAVNIVHAGGGYGIHAEADNSTLDAIFHGERASGTPVGPVNDKGMVAHFDYKPGTTGTKQGVLISSGVTVSSDHAALRVTAATSSVPGVLAAAFEGDVSVGDDLTIAADLKMTGTIAGSGTPVSNMYVTSITGSPVNIVGALTINGLAVAPGKSFTIDHPLDPDNKILRHMSIESDKMINVYSGSVITSGDGYAEIQMPDWCTALNTNFTYGLTVTGKTFAQAIVWEKIDESGIFVIKTDEPNISVDWQLIGERHDKWALENPNFVEAEKPDYLKGESLHPSTVKVE